LAYLLFREKRFSPLILASYALASMVTQALGLIPSLRLRFVLCRTWSLPAVYICATTHFTH